MIWLLFIIYFILICGGAWLEDDGRSSGIVLGFIGVFGIILVCVAAFFLILAYPYNVDKKIAMYEEENTKIEEKVKTTVKLYMKYEADTYKEMVDGSDLTTLLVTYPELNSNELVKSEVTLYIENNKQIKALKEKKINRSMYRFWLYFGK